jgi:hypothetical protein
MNATILNLFNNMTALKPGNGAKTNASGGQQSAEDILASLTASDKSGIKVANVSRKNHEANFTDALRKKMAGEKTATAATGETDAKVQVVKKDPPETPATDTAIPAYVICEKPEAPMPVHPDGEAEKPHPAEDPVLKMPEGDDALTVGPAAGIVATGEAVESTGTVTAAPVGESAVQAVQPAGEPVQRPAPVQVTVQPDRMVPPTPPSDKIDAPVVNPVVNIDQPIDAADPELPDPPQMPVKTEAFEGINNQVLPDKNISPAAVKPAMQPPAAAAEAPNIEQSAQSAPGAQRGDHSDEVPTEPVTARAAVHKLNVATEQINAMEAESRLQSAENPDIKAGLSADKPLSVEMTGAASTNPAPSAAAEAAKIEPAGASGLSVGRQVQESLTSSYRAGDRQMVIRLDPPELGRVTIRFVEQADGITGVLQVERSQTRHEIQQALPGIVQHLQNADIPVKKIEVLLTPQPQDQSGDNAAGQNSQTGQQHAPRQHAFADTVSYHEWLAHSNAADPASAPRMELTDKSINMLI